MNVHYFQCKIATFALVANKEGGNWEGRQLSKIYWLTHNSHSQTLSLSIVKELMTGGSMPTLEPDFSSDKDRNAFKQSGQKLQKTHRTTLFSSLFPAEFGIVSRLYGWFSPYSCYFRVVLVSFCNFVQSCCNHTNNRP